MKIYDHRKHDSFYEKIKKSDRKKYVYGVGQVAEKIIEHCKRHQIEISGFFVDDEFKTVDFFHGYPVYKKSVLLAKEDTFETLLAIGKSEENIQNIKYFTFSDKGHVYNTCYGFYFPWDKLFFQKNHNLLEQTFNWMEDEYSKCVFNAYLKCHYEGDNSDLTRLATYPQYFSDVVSLKNNPTFIDCGAFTGDTIEVFIGLTKNNYAEIFAFEPNKGNFELLQQKVAALNHNIYVYNKGVSNLNKEACMRGERNIGSVIDIVDADDACSKISLTSIDSIDINITGNDILLKADIEGSELLMLEGAQNFIKKYKPQLAVCVYHKSEDLVTIPQYIKQLNSNYKLYLRHHNNTSTETVLYAIDNG